MEPYKQKLLEKLHTHVSYIQEKIHESMNSVRGMATKSLKEIGSMQPADQLVYMQLKAYAVDRMEQLERLHGSPYFTQCEVVDDTTGETKKYFFAKHQFVEESLYSWVSPIASIRFESPGPITYTAPSGEIKKMTVVRKEQYMIVDGKVLFFTEEEQNKARNLIYQEHFTKQKSEFILPEIVAQMEKAQDTVIRADYKYPLVISGPAGSGKTTLALHRVAYLTQAPDTAPLYTADSIVVLVQDSGTREYFSHLLPGLGIHGVSILTFSEWAMNVLGLVGYAYVNRHGETEEKKDLYEYQKLRALREGKFVYSSDPFVELARGYRKYFSKPSIALFDAQKKEKQFDRFDLTILLQSYLAKFGKFEIRREYNSIVKGVMKKKIQKRDIVYNLVIVDEFQNYLPEQLSILKACVSDRTESILYVGDMGQQVYLGTIKDWSDMSESIKPERNIRLDKVYRNTRNILEYIQSLGYKVGIPEGIKEGPEVVEKICDSVTVEIDHIKSRIEKYKEGSIGVIAKNSEYLEPFRKEFAEHKNIHLLTMNESQGVEFDLVCIVGINNETFAVPEYAGVTSSHIVERKRIQKDLLYIALTRAITELHVLGTIKVHSEY